MCKPTYKGYPGNIRQVFPEEENYVVSYKECPKGHKYIPDQESTVKDCPFCTILKFRELIQKHFGGDND